MISTLALTHYKLSTSPTSPKHGRCKCGSAEISYL